MTGQHAMCVSPERPATPPKRASGTNLRVPRVALALGCGLGSR